MVRIFMDQMLIKSYRLYYINDVLLGFKILLNQNCQIVLLYFLQFQILLIFFLKLQLNRRWLWEKSSPGLTNPKAPKSGKLQWLLWCRCFAWTPIISPWFCIDCLRWISQIGLRLAQIGLKWSWHNCQNRIKKYTSEMNVAKKNFTDYCKKKLEQKG